MAMETCPDCRGSGYDGVTGVMPRSLDRNNSDNRPSSCSRCFGSGQVEVPPPTTVVPPPTKQASANSSNATKSNSNKSKTADKQTTQENFTSTIGVIGIILGLLMAYGLTEGKIYLRDFDATDQHPAIIYVAGFIIGGILGNIVGSVLYAFRYIILLIIIAVAILYFM